MSGMRAYSHSFRETTAEAERGTRRDALSRGNLGGDRAARA
jgi:hypothetical protein